MLVGRQQKLRPHLFPWVMLKWTMAQLPLQVVLKLRLRLRLRLKLWVKLRQMTSHKLRLKLKLKWEQFEVLMQLVW